MALRTTRQHAYRTTKNGERITGVVVVNVHIIYLMFSTQYSSCNPSMCRPRYIWERERVKTEKYAVGELSQTLVVIWVSAHLNYTSPCWTVPSAYRNKGFPRLPIVTGTILRSLSRVRFDAIYDNSPAFVIFCEVTLPRCPPEQKLHCELSLVGIQPTFYRG